MSQSVRHLAINTLVYGAGRTLVALRNLIILPVFSIHLGTADYGAFSQLLLLTLLLVPVVSLRLETGVVRFLAAEKSQSDVRRVFYSTLWCVAGLAISFGALMYVLAPMASRLFLGSTQWVQLIQLGSLLLVVSAMIGQMRQYYRIADRIKTLSVLDVLQVAAETLLLSVSIFMGHGVAGAVWAVIGVRALLAVVMFAQGVQGLGRPSCSMDVAGLRRILGFSMPLVPNSLLRWIVDYSSRLVILRYMTLAWVGVYTANYAFGMVLGLFTTALGFVFYPFVLRLWDDGHVDQTRNYFQLVTRYFLVLTLPACVGLSILSQPVIGLLADKSFQTDALLVLLIALGLSMNGLFQLNIYALHLTHRTSIVMFLLAPAAAINLAISLTFVPRIGLYGAAIAAAVTFTFLAVTAVYFGRRFVGYRIDILPLVKALIAVAAMTVCLWWIPVTSWWHVFGVIALGVAVYGAMVVLLGVVSRQELQQWRSLVRK